jgi:hypothetical protein
LVEGYRVAFPDMLGLIVICVDAGLSLEATLDRIRRDTPVILGLVMLPVMLRLMQVASSF